MVDHMEALQRVPLSIDQTPQNPQSLHHMHFLVHNAFVQMVASARWLNGRRGTMSTEQPPIRFADNHCNAVVRMRVYATEFLRDFLIVKYQIGILNFAPPL